MKQLVHEHTTWHRCCRRSTYRDGSDVGLRTTGPGRRLGGRLGGRLGRRTAALTAAGERRQLGLSRRLVAVTDPTWCGHVWPGGGGQR